MRTSPSLALAALACLLPACRQIGLRPRPVEVERGQSAHPSGLRLEDLFVGQGPAASERDEVTFDYTAWLEDGTRVDSTLDRGVPLTVVLAEAPLPGLVEGIAGMRPQGRRRLLVPPALAYGAAGVEDLVPPDATLVFEVHLLDVVPAAR